MFRKNNQYIGVILLPVLIILVVLISSFFTSLTKVLAATTKVDLLTADNFAILAGSAISDSGISAIIGDVGLSPSGGVTITGLTCSEVIGTIYDTNGGYTGGGGGSTACLITDPGLLTTAKNNLTTAYNDAAGRTITQTIGTELGGSTLNDGVYDSTLGTFGITGTLTLDGQNNPDSVFIFKTATTLITASASRILLTNGAQPCNVYWQVGSSATLGTGTNLVGNVLALSSITDNGGSTINGRLLAQGAVTLNNTTVTKSTCSAISSTLGSSAGSTSGSGSASGESNFLPLSSSIVPPTIIKSNRISPTSIQISWSPYSGVDTFNVRYGPANGNWLYNIDVTGFEMTINNLPPNQPFWFQVASRNNFEIGEYGPAKLVGGPILPAAGISPEN